MLSDQYQILEKIYYYFVNCGDYAMKGTICYVFSFISSNSCLKGNIEQLGWQYFFNSDICFPKDMSHLYLKITDKVENKKVFEDLDKINKQVSLNSVRTQSVKLVRKVLRFTTMWLTCWTLFLLKTLTKNWTNYSKQIARASLILTCWSNCLLSWLLTSIGNRKEDIFYSCSKELWVLRRY